MGDHRPPLSQGLLSGRHLNTALKSADSCSPSQYWISDLEWTWRPSHSGLFISRCPACFLERDVGRDPVEGVTASSRFLALLPHQSPGSP